MPSLVIEAECIAAVPMADGNVMTLHKFNNESITVNSLPSRGQLARGKFYRVTIEEIQCLSEQLS